MVYEHMLIEYLMVFEGYFKASFSGEVFIEAVFIISEVIEGGLTAGTDAVASFIEDSDNFGDGGDAHF